MEILKEARRVFDVEIEELQRVRDSLGESLCKLIEAVQTCKGKIVLCGMGKPGHITQKIAATMNSLGIHSYVLHPAEAMHGDLGTLSPVDLIIFFSNSGETAEICTILPNIRMMGVPIAAVTSHGSSTLAQYADYVVVLPELREAGPLNLAPTSSATANLVLGDAIAVVISEMRRFQAEDFARFHPAGALGRKLTMRVRDIMAKGEDLPRVSLHTRMPEAIIELCRAGLGAVAIVDNAFHLCGLITDGDLKRYLNQHVPIYEIPVDEIMTRNPVTVPANMLAVDALRVMENREKQLSVLPALEPDGRLAGIVRNHDVLKLGIFV